MVFLARYGNSIARYGSSMVGMGNYGEAEGGTISVDGSYKIHQFSSTGTFTMVLPTDCSILILGQGGNGGNKDGNWDGGGGGSAGICIQQNMFLNSNSYPITFGSFPGGTVSFNGVDATGGGNGTNGIYSINHGGNGGSNSQYSGAGYYAANGGGGAGCAGNGALNIGGAGITSLITGSSVVYGKGGNGGSGGYTAQNGFNGPAGIVIIRYKYI
jgi:hypothetical protein